MRVAFYRSVPPRATVEITAADLIGLISIAARFRSGDLPRQCAQIERFMLADNGPMGDSVLQITVAQGDSEAKVTSRWWRRHRT